MIEFDFPAATARQKLRKAQAALNRAEKLLDQHCGFIVNIALLDRIRIAAQRVDRARQLVRKVDPDCPECQGAATRNKDALTGSRSSVRRKRDEERKPNGHPRPRDVAEAPSPNPKVGK
jgi:hypothetical protein